MSLLVLLLVVVAVAAVAVVGNQFVGMNDASGATACVSSKCYQSGNKVLLSAHAAPRVPQHDGVPSAAESALNDISVSMTRKSSVSMMSLPERSASFT